MRTTPSTLPELRAAFVAGDHEGVLAAFAELDFLEAGCRVSVDALIAEIAHVVREAPRPLPVEVQLEHPSGARLDAGALALLGAVVAANREVLARSPERLFPILFRELHWREPALSRLADHLRATFEARADAAWLRPLVPPETFTLVSWRIPGEPRSLSADGRLLLLAQGTPAAPSRHVSRCLIDPVTRHSILTVPSSSGVALSPDGACAVVFAEKSAELWSTRTRASYATLDPHELEVQRAVFARDSRVVFTEALEVVRAIRVADGVCLASRKLESYVSALRPGREGALLIHDGKRWLLWEYMDDRLRPIGDADYVTHDWSVVSPSGDRLIVAEGTGDYSGWSLPEGELLFRRRLPEQVASLAFHPSGAHFTGGQGFYDASTGKELARLPPMLVSAGRWPAFDPSGRFLVTRHEVPEVAQLWDVRDLAAPAVIARFAIGRHTRGGSHARFSADGHVLVFGDWNETVVVDLAAPPAMPIRDDAPAVDTGWRARFSPSGTTVVFGHDRALSFWDVTRGVLRRLVTVDRALTYFAGGSRVLVRIGDALAALDTEDGGEVWRITQPSESSEEAHVADEQGVLVHGDRGREGEVLGLDARDGRARYRLDRLTLLVHDRDVFVTRNAAGDGALRSVATGEVRVTLPGLRGGHVAISPDHRWLAAHEYSTVLWDLTTGARAHELDSTAYSFRFREDSLALVATSSQSAQSGNTDTVWEEVYDVTTGQRIGSSTWDESGYGSDPSPPQEIAPGIERDGDTLRIGEQVMPLPAGAIVCHTPRGELFAASLSPGKRVELYRRGSSAADPVVSSATKLLVRDLVARCPDPATESVLADWCEENERRELVPWLRSERADVRECAVGHLACTLEDGITPDAFRSALRLAHALGARPWYELAELVCRVSGDHEPTVYLVDELRLHEELVMSARWALAAELVDPIPPGHAARARPLARLVSCRCPTCGQGALVVGVDRRRSSAWDDHDEWQEAHVLCLRCLHCAPVPAGCELRHA